MRRFQIREIDLEEIAIEGVEGDDLQREGDVVPRAEQKERVAEFEEDHAQCSRLTEPRNRINPKKRHSFKLLQPFGAQKIDGIVAEGPVQARALQLGNAAEEIEARQREHDPAQSQSVSQ